MSVQPAKHWICYEFAKQSCVLESRYLLRAARFRASKVIWTDDTTVPAMNSTLRKARIGRFWVYIGDDRDSHSVYDFTRRHSRDGPERFSPGFLG